MKRAAIAEHRRMLIRTEKLSKRSKRRAAGDGVVQAFAIASQMALLHPPGVDEWMRRELGGAPGRDRAGARR